MAKWFGKVGYGFMTQTERGVFENKMTWYEYSGDYIQQSRRFQNAGQVNDNIAAVGEIRIVADPFAMKNSHAMQCVEHMGAFWKVSNVRYAHPKLILTIGELWNGPTPRTS